MGRLGQIACSSLALVLCVMLLPVNKASLNPLVSPINDPPSAVTITITQNGLEPEAVKIHPADTVIWKNASGSPQFLVIVLSTTSQINLPLILKADGLAGVNTQEADHLAAHVSPITHVLGVDESFSYVFVTLGRHRFSAGNFTGTVDVVSEAPTQTPIPAATPTATSIPTQTATPDTTLLLVEQGSAWRYLDDGSDAGTSWRNPAFEDGAWAVGAAPLGYGDPMSTTLNGGPSSNRITTTYLRAAFHVDDVDGIMALALLLRRDDGAVVYMNGVEVARSNMPAGAIDYLTLASSTVDGANEAAFFSYSIPVTTLVTGSNTMAVEIHQRSAASSDIGFDLSLEATTSKVNPIGTATVRPTATSTDSPATEYSIMAAGDIANCSGGLAGAHATANLIKQLPNAQVLALGDLAYSSGTDAQFQECYHPTWGQFANRTHPTPGNHEYRTAGAAGYFRYFNASEYYSWDFGGWHFIALNSEIDYAPASAQVAWLRADLAATRASCVLAYWHRPRFSSGSHHGSDASFTALWGVLVANGVSVVLNGHEHHYERFDAQDMNGNASATGIREFVVGTGGAGFYGFSAVPESNSLFRLENAQGVLRMDLLPDAYQWQFIDVNGAVRDSGATRCN